MTTTRSDVPTAEQRQTLSEILFGTRHDPEYRAAVERAKDEYRRAKKVRCPFNNCVIILHPDTGKDMGGMGPVGCAHEYLPGGNAKHPDQLPKPRAAVKAVGRNGSRVQRSIRRHQGVTADGLMTWAVKFYDDLDHGAV